MAQISEPRESLPQPPGFVPRVGQLPTPYGAPTPASIAAALNALRSFGQGAQEFLAGPPRPTDQPVEVLGGQLNRGLINAPIVGGPIQALATAASPLPAAVVGVPALATSEKAREAYQQNRKTLEGDEPGLFDFPAVSRGLFAAGEAAREEATTPAGAAFFGAAPWLTPSPIPGGQFATGLAVMGTIKGAQTAAKLTGRSVAQETAFRAQQAALQKAGLSVEEAARAMNVAPDQFAKTVTTATGAKASPALLTRSIQTALGVAEAEGKVPDILRPYMPGGAAFVGEAKRHGGVIGAATRAVMAGDQEVLSLLSPDLAQQLAQGKIAQLARNAGATEDTIRRALQIMEHSIQQAPTEALGAAAEALKGKISGSAHGILVAAEHAILQKAGLPLNDVTQAMVRASLVAKVRAAQNAAKKADQSVDALVADLRKQGMSDAQIVSGMSDLGVDASAATAALRYPSDVVPGVGPTIQRVREATQPVQPTTLFEPAAEGLRPNRFLGGGDPPAKPPAPPRTPPQEPFQIRAAKGFGTFLGDAMDAYRQVLAMGDLSQLMRQGLVPLAAAAISRDPQRRLLARQAFVDALRGYSTRWAGERWLEVTKDPLYHLWREAGGAERAIPGSIQQGAKSTELYGAKWLKDLGVAQGSEASFALTLNELAFRSWKDGYDAIKAARGRVTPAEQKALANFYNAATGHGRVPADLKGLNRIFWAPRFAVSRVETPVIALKYLADPATREVGKIALADLTKTVVAGATMLKFAELAGFRVSWDPGASDFGKIRYGDTSVDIWGGHQQPAVLLLRAAFDTYTTGSGKKVSISQAGFGQPTLMDLISRYVQGKLHPGIGRSFALLAGRNFVGEPFGPRGGQSLDETILKMIEGGDVTPLAWGDGVQAIIDDLTKGSSQKFGLPPGTLGITTAASNVLGVGAQTYERSVAYDGIGRDIQGELPPSVVLDTWKAVSEGSEKNASGSSTFSDLSAPTDTFGQGERQIVLTPEEYREYVAAVGREREAIISQFIASPAFQSGGQKDRERVLTEARAFADRVGRTNFAVSLAQKAPDDAARIRAIRVGLQGASRADAMDLMVRMQVQGTLTQEVKAGIDSLRSVTDPTVKDYDLSVDDHLQGAAMVAGYLNSPAFRTGDPAVWQQVAQQGRALRATYTAMQRVAQAQGVSVQRLDAYRQYARDFRETRAGNYPIGRFLSQDATVLPGAISPERQQIMSDPLFRYFRDIAKQRDPYNLSP